MSPPCRWSAHNEPLYFAPPYGIWDNERLLNIWQDKEYGEIRPQPFSNPSSGTPTHPAFLSKNQHESSPQEDEVLSDFSDITDADTIILQDVPEAEALPISDEDFVSRVKGALELQGKCKTSNVGRRQARRILQLLQLALPASPSEALQLSSDDAREQVDTGRFVSTPIITENEQSLPLHTVAQFLDEYYDDTATVSIQDPAIRLSRNIPSVRIVTVAQLKKRFREPDPNANAPWNCLELATHVDDGLRPAFLNNEESRLLTKLKLPNTKDSASRRHYEPGWKEVEKWALLAQAGALTEPHQDSHGYNTYITVNQGIIGFGWLSNPTAEERRAWCQNPMTFVRGEWRYKVLRPGQTVYFPSGTVHFVFRLKAAGDTLAFGGHVLRCSQIVHWVETMLEEKAGSDITNEELTVSAPAYLERVERFVRQALKTGQVEKWGGAASIRTFLALKQKFMKTCEVVHHS